MVNFVRHEVVGANQAETQICLSYFAVVLTRYSFAEPLLQTRESR